MAVIVLTATIHFRFPGAQRRCSRVLAFLYGRWGRLGVFGPRRAPQEQPDPLPATVRNSRKTSRMADKSKTRWRERKRALLARSEWCRKSRTRSSANIENSHSRVPRTVRMVRSAYPVLCWPRPCSDAITRKKATNGEAPARRGIAATAWGDSTLCRMTPVWDGRASGRVSFVTSFDYESGCRAFSPEYRGGEPNRPFPQNQAMLRREALGD